MKLTTEQLDELEHAYGYHAPTQEQVGRYAAINAAAKLFEQTVLENCPPSADRTFACRQIRDARMTANRSIALEKPAPLKLSLEVLYPLDGVYVGDVLVVRATATNLDPRADVIYNFCCDRAMVAVRGCVTDVVSIDTTGLAPGELAIEAHICQTDRQADAQFIAQLLGGARA